MRILFSLGMGYAARRDTCGAVTFGGIRPKAEARVTLEHQAVTS